MTGSVADMAARIQEAVDGVGAAAATLFESDPAIRSVGVGEKDGSTSYVAIRNAKAAVAQRTPRRHERLKSLRGTPIHYQDSYAEPTSFPRVPHSGPGSPGVASLILEQQRQRPLVCGLQIQNIDDDIRTGQIAGGYMTMGSLGCFVKLATNAVAILSNNHVLAGENRGITSKDRILQRLPDRCRVDGIALPARVEPWAFRPREPRLDS